VQRAFQAIVAVIALALSAACSTQAKSIAPRMYWEPGVGPTAADESFTARRATTLRSPQLLELAAAELQCTPDAVRVLDYDDHVKADGCRRMVYYLKHSKTHWERVGPRFDLSPEDVITEHLDLDTRQTTEPVRIAGKLPSLTREQWRNLKAWEVKTTTHCILRVDGTLHHCIVLAPDPIVAEAISASLPTWRFSAAMAGDRPVPMAIRYSHTFRVPKPECTHLSSPMERFKCERAVEELNPSGQGRR
jgi:hypothetical protein